MALTGPHIITPVPGPKSQELLKLREKTYLQAFPLILQSLSNVAKGRW
jgi:hypothetical protein